MRLLPFQRQFSGDDADTHLLEELIRESPGILAWAVEGALRVYDGEPELPERVQVATKAYKEDQDTLGQFIDEECELDEDFRVGKTEFHRAYKGYKKGRGGTQKASSRRMQRRGFKGSRAHGGKEVWVGIRLQNKDLQK